MSMYSRVGCVTDVEQVFLEIERKDVVSWNVMIGAFARNGYGQRALELVDTMVQCSMQPDSLTFTAVLMACCHCGLVDEGLEHFWPRPNYGVACLRCGFACTCWEVCGSLGIHWSDTRMQMRPGALLSASRMHHNVEFARIAFERLVQVEPENAGNFVTMSNIYEKAGMVEDAKRVRTMIDRVELAKPSG
ncbi:hypothetical protein U9M48_007868 [Paspalum notatum var. saurae]|uniref:Pentatricopeptide repeat-containing protein n=1 Tax=Paspalum notatum var. saurae TaxID=547442 RepID=A0AAQ3SNV4_PASNO